MRRTASAGRRGSKSGHFGGSSAKDQHAAALAASGVKRFEPYCLRHTALTRLGESGCDAFTLARIAGHSNIQMTMRYVHPQADAIERAFSRLGGQSIGQSQKKALHGARRESA